MTESSSTSSSSSASTSSSTRVDLYYDILSPYAYFAFEQLTRLRNDWSLDLHLLPAYQSAIVQKSGNQNAIPALVPAKRRYTIQDLGRSSQYFSVPIQVPTMFEAVAKGSLGIQRILTAVRMDYPEQLETITRAFWRRHWSENRDVITKESQLEILQENTGLTLAQAQSLIEKSTSKEVRDLLTTTTETALKLGAFGVPTMIIYDKKGKQQLVFGSDRFPIVAQMIGKKWNGPKPNPNKKAVTAQQQQIKSRL